MTMKRFVALGLIAATLATTAFASAASLGGASGGVIAGDAAIPACDTTGITASYTTSGGDVTAVGVSGLADPGCEGASLSLTLVGASGDSIASGGPLTIPADDDTADNSLTVAVTPNPAAEAVAGYQIPIVGP